MITEFFKEKLPLFNWCFSRWDEYLTIKPYKWILFILILDLVTRNPVLNLYRLCNNGCIVGEQLKPRANNMPKMIENYLLVELNFMIGSG